MAKHANSGVRTGPYSVCSRAGPSASAHAREPSDMRLLTAPIELCHTWQARMAAGK